MKSSGAGQETFEPIAIIGVGALLPDAKDVAEFWQNVLDARCSIRQLPSDRWRSEDHWAPGGPKDVEEGKTYSKIGAWVQGYEFDWRRWRLPPGTLPQIDPCQQWAVSVSAAALEDAGYLGENARHPIPGEVTGVVFANALGGENRTRSTERVLIDRYERHAKEAGISEEDFSKLKESILDGSPRVDEDTMPGELANVVAGRVANLLDLQGPNYTTDAACASAIAAVLDACHLLHSRQVDMMIAGAADRTMDPATFAKFSAIGALSPNHSVPFDRRANGFVMGEGAGALILKRLEDALLDNDRIYSVIRGIGASSDGRGKGITAPSQRGQIQAINRAYSQAGYDLSSVELIEAHGTSTSVGDATELASLAQAYGDSLLPGSVAVGSVKSQIGHLKAAAGLAGILKAVLALHNRTIPPSAGFEEPNDTVPWAKVPFYVPTTPGSWPEPGSHPRRAGVSAFGFGGTNFHIALEQYHPETHNELSNNWRTRLDLLAGRADSDDTKRLSWDHLKALEGGVLLLNADSLEEMHLRLKRASSELFNGMPTFDESPTGRRLSRVLPAYSSEFKAEGIRLSIVAVTWRQLEKRLSIAIDSIEDPERYSFLESQQILIETKPVDPDAKLAHMYPGQGSQYLGMTLDLAQRYGVVNSTWAEADEIMRPVIQDSLSRLVLSNDLTGADLEAAQRRLTQTEYTQPAMLTADLAIDRLLAAHQIRPDMVAGHSLGEYAALMVSGILSFQDAMRAAAARGTEMGSVDVPDPGLMAAIGAPEGSVLETIGQIDGYVIAANRNSPNSTVIAGETEAVRLAMKALSDAGATVIPLQTSHAFHTEIVAPANGPLKRFLESIDISLPDIPITANVDGSFYPSEAEDVRSAILGKLAPQMSSPVNWIDQIETMYAAGARLFLEVGPKRALSSTVNDILGDEVKSSTTNHPKVGGIATFLGSLAFLSINGKQPIMDEWGSDILSPEFRSRPSDIDMGPESKDLEALRIRSRPLPTAQRENSIGHHVVSPDPMANTAGLVARILAEETGYPANVLEGRVDLMELGLDDSKLSRVVEKLSKKGKFTGSKPQQISVVEDLVEWYGPKTTPEKFETSISEAPVVSGVSLGVPGMSEVFDEEVWDAILAGRNLISEISAEMKQKLVDKRIVRLVKSEDGTSRLVSADTFETVPQLAGMGGAFDLIEQYGIDPKLVEAFDVATSLAFASGLEALRDAGLPLFPIEQTNSSGMRVIRRWTLPESERDRTGVIFASVFPGLEKAIEHALKENSSEESQFDRKYLLQVLSMGHSQFASWIGARGPNLAINNACASTPAAFAIAEDWMARGRCDRVIIVSGDDSTSDTLMPWIGSGFAGAGAHAMGNVVEEVALPFDARRHGMLLGMGGAGFVLERLEDSKDRGVMPYVELLGAEIANSAFHPTRLDTDHAASVMESFVSRMENRWGLERSNMANRMTFMSHEPYTPPRGGSASAEVSALRHVFGRNASDILITNAKGYTGHPMGVGLEDAVVIRGLAAGVLPPVANHMVDDPALGTLNLCKGGQHELDLALRHGAGFGSQIALTLMRRLAVSDTERFDIDRISNWTLEASGGTNVDLRVIKRKLVAYVDADENLVGGVAGEKYSPEPISEPMASPTPDENIRPSVQQTKVKTPEVAPAAKPKSVGLKIPSDIDDTRVRVLKIVAEFTGYPQEFIEMDADMEGELGIDSIKQAEIMAEIRSTFALPLDEEFQLRDHPTLAHILVYISSMNGAQTIQQPDSTTQQAPDAPVPNVNSTVIAETVKSKSDEEALSRILPIVVQHTGYPQEFIEIDADMEGELGIDSIKQAEIMSDIRTEFNLEIDDEFQIRDHPTLRHVVAYVSGFDARETTPVHDPGIPAKDEPQTPPEIHRHSIEIENMASLSMGHLPSQILITRDRRGVADALSATLQSLGTSHIFVGEGENEAIRNVDTALIHLAPLDAEGTLASDPEPLGWALSTHSLLKDFDTNPDVQVQTFVTVSALDGAHGFHGRGLNSAAAGIHGVAMSYGRERPKVSIRAIDLSPELLDNPESAALAILAEATRKTGPIEVGIAADLKRQRIALRISDAPSPNMSLDPSDVWIVSGGAAGVTAECMIRLASSEKSDSPTFILLGRTPLDPELANLANSDDGAMEDEKAQLKKHLDSISSSGKVTLKQWEDAWQSRKRAIGIHSTLSRLRAAGAIAEYVSVDVTSRSSVDSAIDSIISNHGPITGIVHGAGIEDSTPFDLKSDEIVKKVMDVKVGGWLSIYDSLSSRDQPVRFACSFTSVAGRLGNAAQLDYCAANRILDAEHARISSEDMVSISIAWSPWAGAGMATRGSLETVFDRAGVDMIPVDEGARMFVEEVLGSVGTSVLIAGKLGTLDHRRSVRRKEVNLSPRASSEYGDPLTFPMIEQILKCDVDGKTVTSICLDPDSHRYLNDHSISGVPYFPGVMALEMMAETVSLCSNNGKVASFEDVEFGIPVKITRGIKEIRCTAEPIQHDGAEIAFSCTIESIAPGGLDQAIAHHKAIAILRSSAGNEPIPDIIPEEEDGSRILASADIYNRMFHGPRFQPLIGVVASIQNENGRGIEARVHGIGDIPNPELFNMGVDEEQPGLIAHPMLIESCFQAAGLTSMDTDGADSLPVGARRIVLLDEIPDGSITVLSVRTGSSSDSSTLHDSVIRLDGAPVLKIDGLMMKPMAFLDVGERPGLLDTE